MRSVNKRKRLSWSQNEKRTILAFVRKNTVNAAVKKFSCDKSQISRWTQLYNSSPEALNDSFGKNRNNNVGRHLFSASLEEYALNYLLSRRRLRLPVSGVELQEKSQAFALHNNIEVKCTNGWLHRFKLRNNLSTRSKTHTAHHVPDNADELILKFEKDFADLILKHGIYDLSRILNMDETPVCYDMPLKKTLHSTGSKDVKINNANKDKTRFTAVLAVSASGAKLPVMTIFRGKRIALSRNVVIPNGLIAVKQLKAWMNEEMMKYWINNVLKPWRISTFGINDAKKCILALDEYKTHLTHSIQKLLKRLNFEPLYIPGGLTALLQPLDVSVNRSFKCKLRKEWNDKNTSTIMHKEDSKEHPQTKIMALIAKVWPSVEKNLVVHSFEKCNLTYDFLDIELFGIKIAPSLIS